MKDLSKRFSTSLLVTSFFVSSAINVAADLRESAAASGQSGPQRLVVRLNSPATIISSLHAGTAQLEQALLAGVTAQQTADELEKKNADLNSQVTRLKFQNVVLTAQKERLKALEEERASHKSNWQRFKEWVSKIDATKVVTTVVSGLISLAGIVLILIL